MKINCKSADLHNPLFLGGVNLQMKLDISKRVGLTLTYDRVEKELIVELNNHVTVIPSSNIANYSPVNAADIGVSATAQPQPVVLSSDIKPITKLKPIKVNAQVSDPTRDQVFGKGK